MLNDIKLALRGFAKTRGFTAIAVATLALAIGANSAVFSLINALLCRPLPYQEPSRIALIWEQFKTQGLERIPCSPPEFLDLQKNSKAAQGSPRLIIRHSTSAVAMFRSVLAVPWYRRRYFHCSGSSQLKDARSRAKKRESVTTM